MLKSTVYVSLWALFNKYYVAVGSFHLLICKINHLLCFSAASWPVIKFTMANLSFMYVFFEEYHLSNIIYSLYTKAMWGTTKKRIKKQK